MVSHQIDASILVIDDDAEVRYSLQRVLSAHDYQVSCAASGNEGIEMAEKEMPTVIFLDNQMDGMSGLETLQHFRNLNPRAMVILMTAYSTTQTAIEAMKFGAFDYIVKPFETKHILSLTENAIKAQQDFEKAGADYTPLLNIDDYKEGIVGSSQQMQEVFKVIGQVADPFGQDRDLHFGAARVVVALGVVLDDFLLALGGNRHSFYSATSGKLKPRTIFIVPLSISTSATGTLPDFAK